jgi:excisionase family DNA binding protein
MNYPTWIRQSLDALDDLPPELSEHEYETFRETIREAGRRASLAGVPEAVKACDIRAGGIGPVAARTILAACLEAAPEPPVEPPDLLTVEAVASKLQCSPSHVYRLADGGRMPRPVKVGGAVRWVRTELDAWIAGGCKGRR